jgi:hypothetical protein
MSFGLKNTLSKIEQIFEKNLCGYQMSDIIRAENREGIKDASV